MGAAAPKPPLAIHPHSKLQGILAFSHKDRKCQNYFIRQELNLTVTYKSPATRADYCRWLSASRSVKGALLFINGCSYPGLVRAWLLAQAPHPTMQIRVAS